MNLGPQFRVPLPHVEYHASRPGAAGLVAMSHADPAKATELLLGALEPEHPKVTGSVWAGRSFDGSTAGSLGTIDVPPSDTVRDYESLHAHALRTMLLHPSGLRLRAAVGDPRVRPLVRVATTLRVPLCPSMTDAEKDHHRFHDWAEWGLRNGSWETIRNLSAKPVRTGPMTCEHCGGDLF